MNKFPVALKEAIIKRGRIYLRSAILEDDSVLVEYMHWKSALGINLLTASKLKALFRKGVQKEEIRELFKNNNKYAYLVTESERRGAST